MELLALIIAALALVLGIWHILALNKQLKELKKVQGSLSTRYIGRFPTEEFLSEIIQSVELAKEKITVLCDFPAYAAFASPNIFIRYRQALELKARDPVGITIVCYGPSKRDTAYKGYFGRDAQGWEDWKRSHSEDVETYLKLHGGRDVTTSSLKMEDLLMLLEADNKKVCEIPDVDYKPIETHIPLFVWFIDDNTAIFSIPGLPEDFSEHGFFTLDQRLITALEVY